MEQFTALDSLASANNGYLLTSQALQHGISKPVLADYVRKRNMERVAHGVYLAADAWPDAFYQLYLLNRRIVFSHESALFLHGLMEREPNCISVTVPAGYNATHLRRRNIRVYQCKPEFYNLGTAKVRTNFDNEVNVYDRERTICDIIRSKDKLDVQVFQYAMKEYMASADKDLVHLMAYAKAFRMESVVRIYTEVML